MAEIRPSRHGLGADRTQKKKHSEMLLIRQLRLTLQSDVMTSRKWAYMNSCVRAYVRHEAVRPGKADDTFIPTRERRWPLTKKTSKTLFTRQPGFAIACDVMMMNKFACVCAVRAPM